MSGGEVKITAQDSSINEGDIIVMVKTGGRFNQLLDYMKRPRILTVSHKEELTLTFKERRVTWRQYFSRIRELLFV